MSIQNNKILGGIGALLMFLGVIPYISYFGVIEIIGALLVIVALYNLSRHYGEGGIFNNALYGLIAGIVGVAAAVGVVFLTLLTSVTDFLHAIFPDWNGDWTALSGLTPNPANISFSDVIPILAGIFVVFIILWLFAIIATFFVRRSLVSLSAKSGVGLFSTAGLLLLIGAVCIILVGFGLILMWIAALLLAIAFFRMRSEPPPLQPSAVA